MSSESIFIAHPTNEDELSALKAMVKALKIKFEIRSTYDKEYDSEFVSKINESKQQYKNGDFTTVNNEDELKSFLDID